MKLTAGQARALKVIEAESVVRPREFAKLMWPESAGWRRSSRCGPNGVHRGGGMYLAAGGYLGKMAQLGLVRRQFRGALYDEDGYKLTEEGKKSLEEFKKKQVVKTTG